MKWFFNWDNRRKIRESVSKSLLARSQQPLNPLETDGPEKRYQRLCISEGMMQSFSEEIDFLPQLIELKARESNSSTVRQGLVERCARAAYSHLMREEPISAKEWAVHALSYANDFFFGPWRDTIPYGNPPLPPPHRQAWFENEGWITELQVSLVWGSALGEWEFIRKIAGYFQDGVSGNCGQSESNYSWWLLLTGVLQGRDPQQLAPYREKIESGRGRARHEKPLLEFLDAICQGSDQDVHATSRKLFAYVAKANFKNQDFFYPMLCEGSFLVHYARHQGRPLTIPESILDRIVTFDQWETAAT